MGGMSKDIGAWKNKKIVNDYSRMVKDPSHNWFEEEINIPELFRMIPEGVVSILDFGCGPGDVTSRLMDYANKIEGSDLSEGMIKIAKSYNSKINFFVWDGLNKLSNKKFDLIFSKLTFQFVEDLHLVAKNIAGSLNDKGSLVLSVPHPTRVSVKEDIDYHNVSKYEVMIGDSGIVTNMIHRSLKEYADIFTEAGFLISAIKEPNITSEMLRAHGKDRSYAAYPLRLNMRLIKK